MTYEGLYRWGREELLSAEITEAQLDARLLLESVCGTGGTICWFTATERWIQRSRTPMKG